MASEAPPTGPGRGVSQLYPTASVAGRESQAPSASASTRSVSPLHPSPSRSPSQAPKALSKAPSSTGQIQSHRPTMRPSQAPSIEGSSQATYTQPTIRPSHAATLRAASQAPSHQTSMRPSHAANLRGQSKAPSSYTASRSPINYTATSPQTLGRGPSLKPFDSTTELQRDVSRQPTIMLQTPSNRQTYLQRDPSISQPTLLNRDQSQMLSSMTTIKEVSIGPSKAPENISSTRSILHTPLDIQMASRQPTINNMKGAEREEQESWALGKLVKLSTGCPQNYGWSRRSDGYICDGGSHYITDLLLAEGLGGMFVMKNKHEWQDRSQGPYYWVGKNAEGKNLFSKNKDAKVV
ncbi:uncharacterized protein EAF01_009138 [Botrytis porri]|uniref:Uncharacterized protein n=1 Tax=Botrytis porri TaxID=87229 RepID=A0A4Z1KCR2_9HELO|nr:uncharacterized protein EAF01_009138 [Botrytis porri]KAF7896735.1 hypothetical protein EAF01_009138 [Botrytis porri]TGO83961.1 hypothetical protein BPOR_0569g00070 [Botrytis porri]